MYKFSDRWEGYIDNSSKEKLKSIFHNDMIEIYKSAKKEGYTPSHFLRMITDTSGYEAALKLIHANTVSEGFTKLWELKRLDLSVENYAQKSRYRELFTDEEIAICRQRLADYGFTPTDD